MLVKNDESVFQDHQDVILRSKRCQFNIFLQIVILVHYTIIILH